MAEKQIRDFIYIDGDRLNSLYSQIREGLVKQIVDSRIASATRDEAQNEGYFRPNTLSAQFTEQKDSSETRVLHDYLYSELEGLLENAILTPENLTQDNYRNELSSAFVIKIKGMAEISDYVRIKELLKNFNSVVEAGHYFTTASTLTGNIEQTRALFEDDDSPEGEGVRAFLRRLDDPRKMARLEGLLQDEKMMAYILEFMDLFYPNGLEITIIPETEGKRIAYRGLIDSQWLRLSSSSLRHLYAGTSQSDWTMVGQVTHVPLDEDQNADPPLFVVPQENAETGENPGLQIDTSVRGTFTALLQLTRTLESRMIINGSRTEVVIMPLAIYRETTINLSD